LQGEITFLGIEELIERVVEKHTHVNNPALQEIAELDQWARETAAKLKV
jgi:1-deoxy-D-xylulose-5-phosphate reductoisomerase